MKRSTGTIYFLCVFLICHIVAKEVYNARDYTRVLLILNILQIFEDNVVSFSYAMHASIETDYSFPLSKAGFSLN